MREGKGTYRRWMERRHRIALHVHCPAYSMLTSHVPSFEGKGQQLTEQMISKFSKRNNIELTRQRHITLICPNIPPLQHCQAPSNGERLPRSLSAITFGPSPGANFVTLGSCLNCNAVPNTSEGGCASMILRCADAGSEIWRFMSPFNSRDWMPPSWGRESEICSLMTMCTLRID